MELVNVSGGGSLGREIDLQRLYEDFNAQYKEYNPKSHAALSLKFEEEGATVLAFRTGKFNIAGAQSLAELHETGGRFANEVAEGFTEGFEPDSVKTEVRNLVYQHDLGRTLRLEELSQSLSEGSVDYEPEQFPGLHYRIGDRGAVFKIFSTGKVVLTGVSSSQEAEELLTRLKSQLSNPA